MHAADAGTDVQIVLSLPPVGERSPGFHRSAADARHREVLTHLDRRLLNRPLWIPDAKGLTGKDARRPREGIQRDIDRVDRIMRLVLRFGQHDRHGIPLEPHLSHRQHRPPDRKRLLGIRVRHELVGQAELTCNPSPDDARHFEGR